MKMDAVKELKIDKSLWTPVKFGDVAFEPKESVKDPRAEGIDHVVGLEHIDPENIHLTRSDSLEQSTTFTKKFAVGDVLFGRRRAYLKKAAQANFEGICSGDITVIRAKDNLLPELLPFVVQNEKFFDYAIKHSAGGLSPRVKFKDLAKYELLLPPKDQQALIADLLWVGDDLLAKEVRTWECLEIYKNSHFEFFLKTHTGNQNRESSAKVRKIEDVIAPEKYSCVGGPFGSSLTGKDYVDAPGVPVIRGANLTIGDAKFIERDFVYVSEEKANSLTKNMAYRGDVIVTQRGTLGQVGLIPMDSSYERYIVSQSQMKLKVDEGKAIPEYIYYYLLSRQAQYDLEAATICTGIPHINLGIFKKFPIVLPSLDHQKKIIDELNDIDKALNEHKSRIADTKRLQKALINKVF